MKQLVFMIAVTLIGIVGVFAITPFYGVAVYYLYAILRPQYLWEWSLPRGVAWSFYVAAPTIAAAVCVKVGIVSAGAPKKDGMPFTGAWSLSHSMVLTFGGWVVLTYLTAYSREAGASVFEEYLKIFIMFLVASILIRTPNQVWIIFLLAGSSLAYIAYEVNFLYLAYQYLGIAKNGYCGLDNNGARSDAGYGGASLLFRLGRNAKTPKVVRAMGPLVVFGLGSSPYSRSTGYLFSGSHGVDDCNDPLPYSL